MNGENKSKHAWYATFGLMMNVARRTADANE